ncbi:apolipoprotein N-acyltransferase [Sulfuricystis thermophila]|uniref:apolipoprotein N-acyltransferase n=1 Tax=Sulfuricystis thermophila TaxID=2496847 RepID=UPI001036AC8B|nr:apolipoprotein N-acyltransferase [Sulfuricystis thermophila]
MRQALFAAGLGAATVLGFAPFELFALPVFTLALLFRLWQRAPSARAAAGLGFAWGLGFFLTGVSWVYVSLHDVGGMAAPLAVVATLLFCAYLALFPALAAYLACRLASADFVRQSLLLAGLWTLTEWLRGWLFTGFPWLAIGYSATPPNPLAGFAPVLGIHGMNFLVALVAALFAHGTASRSRTAGVLATVGLIVGSGLLLRGMDWTQPTGAPLKVALLQGNIPQSLKWRPENLQRSIDSYLDLARQHPAALTVLPETSIPLFFDALPREIRQGLAQHGDVLLGIAIRHREGGYVNGAVALGQAGAQSYAKRHLVPFGEYIPPGFAWFFDLVSIPMADFSAGPPRQEPLDLAGQKIAPNICYEDLFGNEIRAALPAATLLVNLSNTAWFGNSLAQPQHLQISRLRALETGRMMLRATNTGMTAAIAPDGRVLAALPPFTRGALIVEAQGFAGITPYLRWGDGLALLLAIGAILPGCFAAYRKRRSR